MPVYFEGDRAIVYVGVGTSKHLKLGIDTGAGGIRIWQDNLSPSDYERTGIDAKVRYGAGHSGLAGEMILAKVKIGEYVIPGKTKLQLVTGHICSEGASSGCNEDGSRRGFAGTIGLRTFHFNETIKSDKVINPLIQSGPFAYILSVPIDDDGVGKLIINPSDSEKSRFVNLPVKANEGQKVPVCINKRCFDALWDTGAPSNAIPVSNKKELSELNLTVDDEKVAVGTLVPIKFGQGNKSFTLSTLAGKRGSQSYRVKELKHGEGTFGIYTYRQMDVLYDFEKGTIGFAPKK